MFTAALSTLDFFSSHFKLLYSCAKHCSINKEESFQGPRRPSVTKAKELVQRPAGHWLSQDWNRVCLEPQVQDWYCCLQGQGWSKVCAEVARAPPRSHLSGSSTFSQQLKMLAAFQNPSAKESTWPKVMSSSQWPSVPNNWSEKEGPDLLPPLRSSLSSRGINRGLAESALLAGPSPMTHTPNELAARTSLAQRWLSGEPDLKGCLMTQSPA